MNNVISLLTCFACISCSAGSSSADTPASKVQTAAPFSRSPSLTPIVLAPGNTDLGKISLQSHWSGSLDAAAQLFIQKDYEGARARFAEGQESDPAPERRTRRALMIAICDSKTGNHSAALSAFTTLLPALPQLADYLRYAAARSAYYTGDHELSLSYARMVSDDSIHSSDAELLIGEILRTKPDFAATNAHYAKYLTSHPNGIRRAEARFRLAEATEKMQMMESAAQQYKVIVVQFPLTSWATKAEVNLQTILPKLPPAARQNITHWSAQEYIERGQVLYRNMRNKTSEADFASALSAKGLNPELRCVAAYHRANSVFKQRDRTRAAPLFITAIKDCKKANNDDLTVKAAYQAGRSYAILGDSKAAIAQFSQIERLYPKHSYADDARVLAAEEYERLGASERAKTMLGAIATLYPDGDMGTEALWRLAFAAYKDKDYEQALQWLKKQLQAGGIDDRLGAEGQAQYWVARTHAQLQERDKSIAAYRQVIRDYPLSYYALLALNRLRQSHPEVFADVQKEIHRPPANKTSGALVFQKRDSYTQPGFVRAIEFLRLGLLNTASIELSSLGFRSPSGRSALTDENEIDKAWAIAFLHHSIGNYNKSLWSTRWHVVAYKRHWPAGQWRKRWDIAYPLGYWGLIEEHAKARGVPPELVLAFVREESGFDPRQESFANAIGLSQLVDATAKRFAKGAAADGSDIVVNRESLRDPDKNLRIGTAFMGFLMKKWQGQLTLIPPSYNAGEGAVSRWMRERGDWERDMWVEAIPYDESRRYAKRVLSSYFAYRYLLHDEIPTIEL